MTKMCRECQKVKSVLEFQPRKGSSDGYRNDCRACRSTRGQIYYQKNKKSILEKNDKREKPGARAARAKKWRTKNPERNRELNNAKTAFRRAAALKATPPWLTKEHKKQMRQLYKNCSKQLHVDHIEPLLGKDVCGLHVPWNLRLLEASLNQKKSNKRVECLL